MRGGKGVSGLGNIITWWSAERPEAAGPGSCWGKEGICPAGGGDGSVRLGPPPRERLVSWEQEVLLLSTEKLENVSPVFLFQRPSFLFSMSFVKKSKSTLQLRSASQSSAYFTLIGDISLFKEVKYVWIRTQCLLNTDEMETGTLYSVFSFPWHIQLIWIYYSWRKRRLPSPKLLAFIEWLKTIDLPYPNLTTLFSFGR